MGLRDEALAALRETSRTFFIPISRLPVGDLQDAVMAAYLCLRAIDEIEDHAALENQRKAALLHAVSATLQTSFGAEDFAIALRPDRHLLPEVTLRVADWAMIAPASVAPRVWEATATMADRMARWAENGWAIRSETDLDRYTFGVAGSVGLLLSDLWAWYNDTRTDRALAVGFGRGLQSVNILRNHHEDLTRGVEFFPPRWQDEDMRNYARRHLALADAYCHSLPSGPVLEFCAIPLALAHATVDAHANGDGKLSRDAVLRIVAQTTSALAGP